MTGPGVTDAAHNAVAVASLAWQQETEHLRYVLGLAASKGLSVADLCTASGLDAVFVERLLAEAGAVPH